MVKENSRRDLMERRSRLLEAIGILQQEVVQLEQELNSAEGRSKAALTEEFFWTRVYPALIAEPEMTSVKLLKALMSSGAVVEGNRFRTFLSRTRKRGLLEMREEREGWPKWRLSEAALQEGVRRTRKA